MRQRAIEVIEKNEPRILSTSESIVTEMPKKTTSALTEGQRMNEEILKDIQLEKGERLIIYRPSGIVLEKKYANTNRSLLPSPNDTQVTEGDQQWNESGIEEDAEPIEEQVNSFIVLFRNPDRERREENQEQNEETKRRRSDDWSAWMDDIAEANALEKITDEYTATLITYEK